MKVVLLGYMASGKTTIGKLLSDELNLPFIDLDSYIEVQERMEVSEIFRQKGEVYFRLKEHQYLKELLNKKNDFVLSLGGGTPCYADNINFINEDKKSISIYLQASITTITNRLNKSVNKRPLLLDLEGEKLFEFIAKHLFERQFFYNKATKKVVVDSKSKDEILTEIKNVLS